MTVGVQVFENVELSATRPPRPYRFGGVPCITPGSLRSALRYAARSCSVRYEKIQHTTAFDLR